MIDLLMDMKIKRNNYGQNAQSLTITLPGSTVAMVRMYAKDENFTLSAALNNLLWRGYKDYRKELEEHDR
jgi:hypothetical protein